MSTRRAPVKLHDSLTQPVLASISFLNEVMSRHPDAISFAPGAPHPRFLRTFEVDRHIERFLEHTGTDRRRLFEYGPARGLINDLVARALATDYGVALTGREIVITVGAQEAMLLVVRALLSSGDQLAIADPCFPGIVGVARILDIETVAIPDNTDDGLDLDRLALACRRAGAEGRPIRACYVAPDYANPSGSRMSNAGRQALLDLAESEDLLIIEDNTYGFTAAPDDQRPPLLELDESNRVVHVGTFAKIAAPGLRVGFVVAPQRFEPNRVLADYLAALKTMTTVNTPPLCQAAIGGLLLEHSGSLEALGRAKGHLYRSNLRILGDSLDRHLSDRPGVRWSLPEGGFFARVMLPVVADVDLLEISARDHGVLWTPMSMFHSDHLGDHVIRLSCSYLEEEEIEQGATRLAAFIDRAIASSAS